MGKNIYNKGCSHPVGGAPHCSGDHALLVSKMIGSAYDIVKYVAMNMNTIVTVARDLEGLMSLVDNLNKLIFIFEKQEELLYLEENKEVFELLYKEFDSIKEVSLNIDSLISLSKNTEALLQAAVDTILARDEVFEVRDEILNIASDVVSQGNVPIYSSKQSVAELEIPQSINAVRINGSVAVGDGRGGLYIDTNNGSTDTMISGDGRVWYRVQDIAGDRFQDNSITETKLDFEPVTYEEQDKSPEKRLRALNNLRGVSYEEQDLTSAQQVQAKKNIAADNVFNSKADLEVAEVSSNTHAVRLNGYDMLGDGRGGLYIDVDNGSSDTIVSADGRTWWRVGGTTNIDDNVYSISKTPPVDNRYPKLLNSEGNYLIPVSYEFVDSYVGSMELIGHLDDPDKYGGLNDRSHQGLFIDNFNNRIFLSSIRRSPTNHIGWIYEYDFTNGVVGDLISQSGELTLGHGDFFAVVQENNQRYIWIYRPPSGESEFNGGGDIVRFPWFNGVTSSAIDKVVPTSSLTYSGRINVLSAGNDHLLLQAQNKRFFVKIADLNNQILKPLLAQPSEVFSRPLIEFASGQQTKYINGCDASLIGQFIDAPNTCYANILRPDNNSGSVEIFDKNAIPKSEPEGMCFYWNDVSERFETIISIWSQDAGVVKLYNVSTGDNRPLYNRLGWNTRYYSGGAGGQTSANQRRTLHTDTGISANGLLVGGANSPSRPDDAEFDPYQYRIEQWSNGNGGRYGALISYQDVTINLDGRDDEVLSSGLRYAVEGYFGLHIRKDHTIVGRSVPKSEDLISRFTVFGSEGGISSYVRTPGSNGIGYLSNSLLMDLASTGAVKFGHYNIDTGERRQTFYMAANGIIPSTDNDKTLGNGSNRYSVVYAGSGSINTSDARLKTEVETLTENEINAAKQLSKEIGIYKFLKSVEDKGDEARKHIGMTVQRAIEIMEDNGLNPMEYGFICYDEWDEVSATYDDDGNEIDPYRAAGSIYSFRHDELLLFIARGFDARLSAIEGK